MIPSEEIYVYKKITLADIKNYTKTKDRIYIKRLNPSVIVNHLYNTNNLSEEGWMALKYLNWYLFKKKMSSEYKDYIDGKYTYPLGRKYNRTLHKIQNASLIEHTRDFLKKYSIESIIESIHNKPERDWDKYKTILVRALGEYTANSVRKSFPVVKKQKKSKSSKNKEDVQRKESKTVQIKNKTDVNTHSNVTTNKDLLQKETHEVVQTGDLTVKSNNGDNNQQTPIQQIASLLNADEIKHNYKELETPESSNNTTKIRNKNNVNYTDKQIKNEVIGEIGEELVLKHEIEKLKKIGASDTIVSKVRRVSLESDDYGYDILSFDQDGHELYIEVKSTTNDTDKLSFIITQNEINRAKEYGKSYSIVIIYDIINSPRLWYMGNPFIDEPCKLKIQPIQYRVSVSID